MKKIILTAAVLGLLTFTSCGSDDDSNDGPVCETCEFDVLGIELVTEYCDNGDGTVTVIFEGVEETQDLEGTTFEEFISAIELSGGTCNPS